MRKSILIGVLILSGCTRISTGPDPELDAGADADVALDGGTDVGADDGSPLDTITTDTGDAGLDGPSPVDAALPATALQFDLQPAGTYAGAPLATQPVVSLRDEQGNVTAGAEAITLSLVSGSGQLTGTLTVTSESGVATFSDVGYDSVESAIVLRASAAGLSVDSAPFELTALPPGACQNQDARFATAGGGCQDLATGLVWNRMSTATHTWHGAIWDGRRNGAAPPDGGDYGRSNDYPPSANPCAGFCDNSPNTICHDLFEGAQGDWRMPTHDDLVALSQHLRAGPVPYLVGDTSFDIWSSTTPDSASSYAWAVRLADGVSTSTRKSSARTILCVRGGRSGALELVVEQAPPALGVGMVASRIDPLVVRIREVGSGARVNAQGVTVSLQSTTPLGGTLSVATDITGRAELADWSVQAAGAATLQVVAAGVASTEFALSVGAYPHTCRMEDPASFVTADGGCKDATTGLVWSLAAPLDLTWHEAIWDADEPPPPVNPPAGYRRLPDADDEGRTNDYVNSPVGTPDSSLVDYCHDLAEGGFRDWRMPSAGELQAAANLGQGAARFFLYPVNRWFWSGHTPSRNNGGEASIVFLSNGNLNNDWKYRKYATICVRAAD